MKHKLQIFAISLTLSACNASEKAAKNISTDPATDSPATGSAQTSLVDSEATIKTLSYDAASHSILFKLEYGGCKATKHMLILSDICAESYPMQCSAVLKHPKDFDGSCKMLIQEEGSLALAESFDAAYVTVKSNGGASPTFQVLVDKTGKVAAQVTPPKDIVTPPCCKK